MALLLLVVVLLLMMLVLLVANVDTAAAAEPTQQLVNVLGIKTDTSSAMKLESGAF